MLLLSTIPEVPAYLCLAQAMAAKRSEKGCSARIPSKRQPWFDVGFCVEPAPWEGFRLVGFVISFLGWKTVLIC